MPVCLWNPQAISLVLTPRGHPDWHARAESVTIPRSCVLALHQLRTGHVLPDRRIVLVLVRNVLRQVLFAVGRGQLGRLESAWATRSASGHAESKKGNARQGNECLHRINFLK